MAGDEERAVRERPANDNRPRHGELEQTLDQPDPKPRAGASDCLGDVVLSIARLIGRRMAREDFKARQPANDNEASTEVSRPTGMRQADADKKDVD
jgi:hypothetical protein